MSKLLIRNGTVVDPAANLQAPRDVVIENGQIAALLEPGSAEAATAPQMPKQLSTPPACSSHRA
ncbi:MAG: hypothetical protein R2867_25495 [Caldilineaceae bacterium]